MLKSSAGTVYFNQDEEETIQEDERQTMEKDIREKKAYIWCFGKNSNGELGVQTTKDVLLPKSLPPSIFKTSQTAAFISSGSHHTGIVTNAGDLYMCGSSLHGKLGISSIRMMQITKFQLLNEMSTKVK